MALARPLGERGRADDVVIGTVFAWILGLGVFFLTLYTTDRGGGNGTAGTSVLFGSIFGLSARDAAVAAVIGVGVIVALPRSPGRCCSPASTTRWPRRAAYRSAYSASASSRWSARPPPRPPRRSARCCCSACSPRRPATALRLTDRPYQGMAISTGLGVAEMWAGLALAYYAPRLPPSFAIIAVATTVYLAAYGGVRFRRVRRGCQARRQSAATWRRQLQISVLRQRARAGPCAGPAAARACRGVPLGPRRARRARHNGEMAGHAPRERSR